MKKEKDEYYYDVLIGKRSIAFIDKIKFVKYLKDAFFNKKTSKWLPSEYKSFIRRNNLNFIDCYKVLTNLNYSNIILKEKGFQDFLSKIEKYNLKETSKEKIKIEEGYTIDFIKELQKLRENHFNVSNKKFIEFIMDNFTIDYTENTLHNFFSERKFKE